VNLGRKSGVITQDVDDHRHIDVARFENRLAVVEGFEFGKFVNILFDEVGEPPDEATTLAGRKLAPRTAAVFEGAPRGGDGTLDVGG